MDRTNERVTMPTVPMTEVVIDAAQPNREVEIPAYPLSDRERETELIVRNQMEKTISVFVNNEPIENRLREAGINGFIEAGDEKTFRLLVDHDVNTAAVRFLSTANHRSRHHRRGDRERDGHSHRGCNHHLRGHRRRHRVRDRPCI